MFFIFYFLIILSIQHNKIKRRISLSEFYYFKSQDIVTQHIENDTDFSGNSNNDECLCNSQDMTLQKYDTTARLRNNVVD
jgi:hypothetical protein